MSSAFATAQRPSLDAANARVQQGRDPRDAAELETRPLDDPAGPAVGAAVQVAEGEGVLVEVPLAVHPSQPDAGRCAAERREVVPPGFLVANELAGDLGALALARVLHVEAELLVELADAPSGRAAGGADGERQVWQ